MFKSEPLRTRYGTNTETYALTGRGLTAFLTKPENWSKLDTVREANKALFQRPLGIVFRDSEFTTLGKLGRALTHAGLFENVLHRMYNRLCHELIPIWRSSNIRPPPVEMVESMTPPSAHVVEAFQELATAAVDTAKLVNLGRTYDAEAHGLLQPFHQVVDEMRSDEKFVSWTAGSFLNLREREVMEIKIIDSVLRRLLPRTICNEYVPMPRNYVA
jgi:hypothetical protein